MSQETIRATAGESDFVNECSADSMAESGGNLLQEVCNSVRRFIRNLAFATQVSVAASGVIGCDTSSGECFSEKLFLNFEGKKIPCGDLRKEKGGSVYNVHYYCDGKSDNEVINIEAFVGLSGEKEQIIKAIRTRFAPLGIEVFSNSNFLFSASDANILTIGGSGVLDEHSVGKVYGLDVGNRVHNNSGYVISRLTNITYTIQVLPTTIAVASIHEALHMLGLVHPVAGGSVSIIDQTSRTKDQCLLTLNNNEAEILAENLEGACNNQGVSFDVLKQAAALSSEDAIQACLDLEY